MSNKPRTVGEMVADAERRYGIAARSNQQKVENTRVGLTGQISQPVRTEYNIPYTPVETAERVIDNNPIVLTEAEKNPISFNLNRYVVNPLTDVALTLAGETVAAVRNTGHDIREDIKNLTSVESPEDRFRRQLDTTRRDRVRSETIDFFRNTIGDMDRVSQAEQAGISSQERYLNEQLDVAKNAGQGEWEKFTNQAEVWLDNPQMAVQKGAGELAKQGALMFLTRGQLGVVGSTAVPTYTGYINEQAEENGGIYTTEDQLIGSGVAIGSGALAGATAKISPVSVDNVLNKVAGGRGVDLWRAGQSSSAGKLLAGAGGAMVVEPTSEVAQELLGQGAKNLSNGKPLTHDFGTVAAETLAISAGAQATVSTPSAISSATSGVLKGGKRIQETLTPEDNANKVVKNFATALDEANSDDPNTRTEARKRMQEQRELAENKIQELDNQIAKETNEKKKAKLQEQRDTYYTGTIKRLTELNDTYVNSLSPEEVWQEVEDVIRSAGETVNHLKSTHVWIPNPEIPQYTGAVGGGNSAPQPASSYQISDYTKNHSFNFGDLKEKKAFVIHHTGGRGNADTIMGVFKERNLATQYIIDRDGKIYQVLGNGKKGQHIDPRKAYGVGVGLTNSNTEGVEIIAKDDSDILPVQVEAAKFLAKHLGYRADQIYGHGEINSHKMKDEGQTASKAIKGYLAGTYQAPSSQPVQQSQTTQSTGTVGGAKTQYSGISKSQSAYMNMVAAALDKHNLSTEFKKGLLGQIGREGSFEFKNLVSGHADAKNGQTNIGIISFQKSRRTDLLNFLRERGLYDGKSIKGSQQELIQANVDFMIKEINEDPAYSKTKQLQQSNDKEAIWIGLSDNYIRWARTNPEFAAAGKRNFDTFYRAAEEYYGSGATGSYTATSSQDYTQSDTQSALDKLISEIETDEFRAKTEEEQAALRDELETLKAQLAEQAENQEQNPEQQPTDETATATPIDQQINKEVQDDTFKQVLRFAQVLDDTHLTRLVEAGAISEEHLAQLRELSATKRMLTEMRDTDAVSKTVFEGNTAKTLEESDRGLNTYMLALETAMSSGRTGLAEKILPDLDRWHQSHGTKALAAARAIQMYQETGEPVHIARKKDSQEWDVYAGKIDKSNRDRTAALNINDSPSSIQLVNTIQNEAKAIAQVHRAYTTALGLPDATTQIDLSGLQDFSAPVQPSLDNMDAGMNPTRGTPAPVNVERSAPVDINMVNAMATDAMRENRNLPDPMDFEPVTPTTAPTPSVSVNTDTATSTGLVRGHFNSVSDFNTAREQGQINPNAVWVGRGTTGKQQISLSNFLLSGNTKKDTGSENVRTDVNNLMETIEINGEPVTRIKAGVLGSPINIQDVNKVSKLPQQDRYLVVHDGTADGQLSAHVESANRYMDMLRVSVANNSNMAKALATMAMNPDTEFYSDPMNMSHNFTESKILEQVLPAIRNTLGDKNPDEAKGKWLQDAVSHALTGMGTMMADGQFHSEINREVPNGVKDYVGKVTKYPTVVQSSETLQQWQPTSLASSQEQEVEIQTAPSQNLGQDQQGLQDWDAGLNRDTSVATSSIQDYSSDFQESVNPVSDSSGVIATSAVNPTEQEASVTTKVPTATIVRNSKVVTKTKNNTKQAVATGLNKEAVQTAKAPKQVLETEQEVDTTPTEYIKDTPIPKARVNQAVSVQELISEMGNYKPQTEQPTKIPAELQVKREEARGVIEAIAQFNPHLKVQIQDKDSYANESTKTDNNTIYVDESNPEVLQETAKQLVSKSVAHIADEIDQLTAEDIASFKETEDKLASGELVYEKGTKDAHGHERKRKVMSLRQDLSEVAKTVNMSVGQMLRDNPKIKEQYPDVIARLALATSSYSNLINMGIFDEDTKAILKQIKMKRKNTWTTAYENLVDVISRFFGKETKQHTAYSRLIDALGDASAINAGDYTAAFKQSNTAKIRAFRDADKDTPMTEVKKLLFPVKGKTAEVRHVLQAHFKQESSLKRPLSSIPDFVMNLSQDVNAATSALGFERDATEVQEKQVMDFVVFNQLFTSYLEQAIKVKKNKDYLYQSKANYFIEEDENGNVSIDTNIASALAYAAYDYMMTKGNHQRNTDKEIFGLLGIHDEDVQDAIYLPKEVREAYQYRGVSALTLANSLGSRVAQTLNIKRSSFGSDKMESDLHSALGNWIITAMQGADLIHIQEMSMAAHEANIAKLDMNPEDQKALLEESQETTKANSAFSVARFVSFTDETGEGRNDLLDEIAELNKGTGSFLADIMGGVSMARYPLLRAPKPESVKDKIKRTIAKVSKVQAERVSKAQQESMVVEEDFFALATGLEAEHSDAFHQMIGSQVTQEQLDSKHDRDHAGMLGKAEATKRDWENAVSWITAIPAVNGVREYWDTMFMAVNSRMHLNATVMNIQGSKLHRAMADLKNFKVSIKIKQKGKSTLESMVTKLKDKGSKITAKDLTNEELKLMFYIRAMGENAEGSEDFIETWIKNSEYADTFKTGFTVDKLPSYVFIPAFLDYMGQDYIQDAMKAVTKQMNGEKLTASEMDKITTAVADMDMGASSLRALMEMTKFHNATENQEASVSLTTSLGLGSDGLNNGAALAHIWNGAIDKKLLDRTGFYVTASQYRNYFQARHDNTVGDYYTGFVDFLKAALDPNLSDSYIQKVKDKITRLEDELAKAKTKDPAKQEKIQQLQASLKHIESIQKVHTALSKRSVAKAILVPFNYGAGMKALGRSVFGEFMKDTQAIMVKAANKDKEAYQRYLDGEISKEEYEVLREKIIYDKGKEGKDPSLAELMEVIQDLTGQKTVSLVVENDPTTDGKKYEVNFDTSINPRVLLHAWFDQKTETKLQEVYDNSVGEAVIATLRQYEEDYINAKQVNMELLQANIALFTEVYKKVEANAIQKVIERDTQHWISQGYSDEEALKIAEKEMQIVGLTDQDRQEYVHKIMDKLQAKIHTAYSAERNETGSMIQLTENDSVLKGDTDGISENEFYVMNEDGLLQTFSGNTGIRTRELTGKALLANSAQTQSMDSYISSYAMALGKRININVHDANIGALDNQIDMINHQNKAAFIALASYNGQLESLKALKQTTEAMLELHETKEIELDLSQSGATMGALSALYKQAGSVWQNENNKLDMLMEIETVSQYAGELGEYTITAEDKKLIDKSREQVESVLGKVGETIPDQVLSLAEKYNIKFVKPVEFVSNPRAVKPNYVMGGGTAKTREFEAMMANTGLQYDLAEPDDMKREDNQGSSAAAHQWLKHNVKDYPHKGDNAFYQNNAMKVTYLSVNEADAVYVSDAMYEGKDGRIYTGFKAKEIISYANKLDKPVYLYNQYEKTWLGYDRVKKEYVSTEVGLTSQPAIFEGGGMNADAILALMGDEIDTDADVNIESVDTQDQTSSNTINIWSTEKNGFEALSNLAPRPFKGKDNRLYHSVEHAYQSWKSGAFDEVTFNNPRWQQGWVKIAGTKPVNKDKSVDLMTRMMKVSFEQNPEAKALLLSTQDKTLTHTQDTGMWGKEFPRILMELRTEFAKQPSDEQPTQDFDTPTITNLTELQSYISGLTNAHAFSKSLNKYLMSAVKDFNPRVKIDVSEVTGGYAKYDLSNNTITLDPVIHDPTAADGAKLKLINHELLHALTEASIQSGNPKYAKGIDHLYQMMDQVLQSWHSGTTSPELDDILNIIKDLPREQALSEFVAYGMTEPAMAKFIDNTLKPENIEGLTLSKRVSNAFDYFIAAVYSALGLGKTGYKAFAETVHDLMDSFTDLPITPILHRDSMGASDKTNVSQNETVSNDTTRFSQVFDEIHKQSATEVYKRIKNEGISTEWTNHLDSMVSTIYDTHYESLTADMKSVLDESFDTVFSNNPISMTDKESAAYAAVFAVLKHIYEEGTNRHLVSELNKVYEQVVNQFATVEDYSPEDYTAAQEINDKQYMSYIENQFNEIFRDTSSDAIPKVLALILTNQQFSNKTKAKLKLREMKYDTWFDKLMNIWRRLMNFTRTKFINADNTSDATKKLVTKLVQVDAAVRLQEVNKADQIWNMTYGKAMDLANKANDAAWKLGSKAVMKAADRVVSDGKDTKLSKTLEAAKNVHQYLGELNNHKPLHDTEFTKFAKEHGITDKNLELTHADAAKFGLNSAVEGMLAVTGGDRQLTYGGNQKLKSLTRGILKELANEMLGARGVGLVVQKVGMLANAISQQRADRKKQTLQMFEKMMKNPESFTNEVKSAITRSILMSDASALLNHHSMDDTLALITSHSKRQARYANLEKQLSKLVKNPEELNHMLIQIKKLGYYMVHETTVEDMVKSSEMIATSTSTRWSVPYDQMNQEVYQIVDEMVTLYALSSVDAKYSRSMPKMIENERQLIEGILNTHKALVEQSKEDFKDNPLNYNKGYLPALHDTNVDVQSITLDQWEEYRAKGYKMYAEAPIEQDELDTTEPRLLVYNPNHHVSRYVTGALEMKDTHHKGFAVLDWKTHGKELTEVGIKRMARIHETAKTINAKDYNPADYAGSNLIMVVGTDNLITHYQYEMTGKLRDELLVRNLAFDDVLATMDANLYAKPELKETQRDLAKVLIEDANNAVSGYKKQPSQYTRLHPESQDPRVQEMLRMMPYEFRHEMELAFGKDKPMYVRTSVFNAVFGFRKYSIAEAFDKEAGDKNVLEKMLTGLYRSLFKDEAVNTAAMHQRIIEAIVTDMKDYIVIRSGKVLLGNIVANLFLLLAEGLTPREIVGHTIYAWKEGKAYRAMQAELIQAQMAIRANPNVKAKVKQLTAKIHSLQRSMEANGMHEYMQRGLMSTIVEDIDMGSETVMFRNKEQRAWDSVTEKVPQPARTALKYLTMHPDTPMHKMMSEATQFSDFAAKYALAKHTEAKVKKVGKSKAEAFELGIQAAQEAFINYDTPTSRGMQLANDLGLFMFTKFMLRFQRVLARQLHSNGGHAIAQHLLVESFLPFAGILNPLGIVPNVGMSAAGWFSGFTTLLWLSIFL